MNAWPKVSVITPSFNQARFLEEAILSVLEQDYPDIEYIIVDGGSTDGSVDIIRKYADRLACWVSEPDAGQSDAINKGLQQATGEIWAWMNSDDAYLPGALRMAVAQMISSPEADILYGDCICIDECGNEIARPVASDFHYLSYLVDCNNYIPSGSAFIRRHVAEQIGELDTSMHMVMDMDYWLRAGLVYRLAYLPKALSLYRVYPGAKTWGLEARKGPEMARIYEKLYARPDLPLSLLRVRARTLSNAYLIAAYYAWKVSDRRSFWYYLRKSLLCGPRGWRPTHARMLVQAVLGARVRRVAEFSWRTLRHGMQFGDRRV